MNIIKVRKEHRCHNCPTIIGIGQTALRYFEDGGSYPIRRYLCRPCAKNHINGVLVELDTVAKDLSLKVKA